MRENLKKQASEVVALATSLHQAMESFGEQIAKSCDYVPTRQKIDGSVMVCLTTLGAIGALLPAVKSVIHSARAMEEIVL